MIRAAVIAANADVLNPLARDLERPIDLVCAGINELNPMIAFSGVRSSWLMLARKSLLAALAASSAATVWARRWLSASCSARTSRR